MLYVIICVPSSDANTGMPLLDFVRGIPMAVCVCPSAQTTNHQQTGQTSAQRAAKKKRVIGSLLIIS